MMDKKDEMVNVHGDGGWARNDLAPPEPAQDLTGADQMHEGNMGLRQGAVYSPRRWNRTLGKGTEED